MTKNLITKICAMTLATTMITSFAAESINNPSLGDVPVICKSEIEYKVKLPATIDLQLDDTGDDTLYKCDYDIVVSGVANGKWFHIEADDIELENENGKKLIVPNKMRANIDDEWQNPYTHEETITEDGVTILGTARINSKDIQPGNYNGMANYKFNLVEHKHTYNVETAPDYRGSLVGSPYMYTGNIWQRDGDMQYIECTECGHRKYKEVHNYNVFDFGNYIYNPGSKNEEVMGVKLGQNVNGATGYGSLIYYYGYTNDGYERDGSPKIRLVGKGDNDGIHIPKYFRYNGEWYKTTSIGSATAIRTWQLDDRFSLVIHYDGTKEDFEAIKKYDNWRTWGHYRDGRTGGKLKTIVYCTDGTLQYAQEHFYR